MYISTRGERAGVTASEAILKGIADDGGLYVPETIPKIDFTLEGLANFSYKQIAYEVLKLYLDDYSEGEIKDCIEKAYSLNFDNPAIAPIKKVGDCLFLELFHGRTLAFKDMALSILPHLLTLAGKKNNIKEEIVILTATSGDTGKAALEGFADVDGTKIIVFYPEQGVSEIQKRQMVTQTGKNTYVAAVKGNFDDAQTGVKNIFNDQDFKIELENRGYRLSSANSINIGRLVPQIVYYFYAYGQLIARNEIESGMAIDFTVPTGNFGNILAGWYAKQMGLPIRKLICASNDNKVLYDFFETGLYDINREFILTDSPSMDILISSNLERLLYHLSGDSNEVKGLLHSLNKEGKYKFDISEICAEYATGEESLAAIKEMYNKGYILDTHTAVAYCAAKKLYLRTKNQSKEPVRIKEDVKNVIVSTASPFKFTEAVCKAIDRKYIGKDSFELLEILAELDGSGIPAQIKDIDKKMVLHTTTCDKEGMKETLTNFLVS